LPRAFTVADVRPAGDCTQFEPVIKRIRVPRLGPGRPRTTPDSASADKAYGNRRTRRYLRRRGIRHVIPEKTDQAMYRVRRGRAGGRPPGFDKDRYKKRNTVGRAINKLKNYRAVATRYDKRAYVYWEPSPPQQPSSGSGHDRPDRT
jgi:transposase